MTNVFWHPRLRTSRQSDSGTITVAFEGPSHSSIVRFGREALVSIAVCEQKEML